MTPNTRLCRRLGALAGISIGFFLSVIPPQSLLLIMATGLVVALLSTVLLGLFLLVIQAYPAGPLLTLVLLVSTVTAVFLSPLANTIGTLFVGIIVCGLLGYLLGWLTCLLLCRYDARASGNMVTNER